MTMSKRDQEALIRAALKMTNQPQGGSMFRRLGRSFGATGELLGLAADIFGGLSGRRGRRRDIVDAIKLLQSSGFDVRPGGVTSVPLAEYYRDQFASPEGKLRVAPLPSIGRTQSPPVEHGLPPTIMQPPPLHGRSSSKPNYNPRQYPRDSSVSQVAKVTQVGRSRTMLNEWPEVHDMNTSILGAMTETKPDIWDNEIETPESSNVFSLAYDEDRGICYVTFKAPGKADFYQHTTNSCNGKEYSMGYRPHERGPMYAVGSASRQFPMHLWEQFKGSESKGRWYWNNVRVCGSRHAHQMPVTMVSPSMAGGTVYVPRKATQRGYRVRTVPSVGTGRRDTMQSTLPEELFGQ